MSFSDTSQPATEQTEALPGVVNAPSLFVEYYTDPLCSWSWAFEAPWRHVRYIYGGQIRWRYRMGGLLPDWHKYSDPFNDIRTPAQMGPQWFQVSTVSGMPLDDHIWQIDPPSSSYPACLAVKAAEQQDQGEEYLRRLREAVMLRRQNIARQDALLTVAQQMTYVPTGQSFDLARFQRDLTAPETIEAFRQDLRDAAYYQFGRFPTLVLQRNDGHGLVLVGYRPYAALRLAIEHLVPGLRESRPTLTPEDLALDYITYWQRALAPEVAEALGYDQAQTDELLASLLKQKKLRLADDGQGEQAIYLPFGE